LRYTPTGVGNPIINSGVEIWQRGTSDVTLTAASFLYWADRWFGSRSAGTSGAKVKYVSASGLDGLPNAFRIQRDSGNTSTNDLYACYDLETKDSVRYAGQTITLSFYARAGANYSPTSSQINVKLASGTGTDQGGYATTWTGSTYVVNNVNQAITTSWVRYSFTGTVASSANQLGLILTMTPTGTAGAADYADFTGFQIDLGSVAQPYRRAGGTIQGELAACQRYYEVSYEMGTVAGTSTAEGMFIVSAASDGGSNVVVTIPLQVAKRTPAYTVSVYTDTGVSGKWLYSRSGVGDTQVTPSVDLTSETHFRLYCAVGSAWVPTLIKGQYTVSAEL
jgi:hypothetical protein